MPTSTHESRILQPPDAQAPFDEPVVAVPATTPLGESDVTAKRKGQLSDNIATNASLVQRDLKSTSPAGFAPGTWQRSNRAELIQRIKHGDSPYRALQQQVSSSQSSSGSSSPVGGLLHA